MTDQTVIAPQDANITLNSRDFFNDVIRTLAGELETTVGLEAAEGYVNIVGRSLGDKIGTAYAEDLGGLPRDIDGVAALLVDLKRRIGGDFRIAGIEKDRIHFVNSRCPFGDRVKDRTSLCMMTTNVFGRIASKATGYAHVETAETIAAGKSCCKVTVSLDDARVDPANGYEFFG